jgi:hypothetical protein
MLKCLIQQGVDEENMSGKSWKSIGSNKGMGLAN